ncbi:hypothetical protein LCGC14_0763820 [marine sediment metagenome]|uniref:acyl-homoserine-lactone synthase n=1 Tax=marine sediment metagenome TaxID=412755 RepID=A0A0F9QK54_9ZZZZ
MGFHAVKASEQQSVEIGVADTGRASGQKAVQSRPTFAARIEETVVCVENQHRYGQLYADLLRARKTVFIDQKAWDLPQADGMEFDQYDTPQSRSVVIHEYGRVLAGVRLLPTTAQCGCYSYMLRDAQRGLLPNIPEYILYEPAPVATHVWEATRLFVTKNEPAERRLIIQAKLIKAMANAATQQGATHVIGIVPAAFQRWMNRLGLSALPVGPKLNISGDHTQAAVMYVAGQT